jgi:3-hydroxybutyryl-CoA dehydrogenase
MAEVEKIAVIGFGTMGAGITQVFAEAGFNVIARDVADEILKRGLDIIENGPFGLKKAVAKSRITEKQAKEIFSRIKVTLNLSEAVKDADFIVEAVFENLDLKKKIFSEIDSLCPEHTIIVSNTSTLSITSLAAATKRPEKVAGMHFFNPPQIMKLVEVIRGLRTSNETVEKVREIAIKLGKTPVVCKDIPGFISNRVWILSILEGIRLYEQGIASAKDIDNVMKLGFNWPMGPLELSDLVGLDVLLDVAESLYKDTGNHAHMPPLILRQMVVSGFLGRKTKKGFYEY